MKLRTIEFAASMPLYQFVIGKVLCVSLVPQQALGVPPFHDFRDVHSVLYFIEGRTR